MTTHAKLQRWTAGALAAAVVFLTLAPAAQADHGRRRARAACDTRIVREVWSPRYGSHFVYRERSSAGPVLAGLIGGFLIGTAVASSARPVHASVEYRYVDPYCGGGYASIDDYWSHSRRVHHPRVLRVIDVSNGECVRTLRYDGDRWQECGDRWDDRDRGYDGDDWDD